jgi:hypothetical protein
MGKASKNKTISVEELHEIMRKTPMRPSKKTEEIQKDIPGFLALINDKSRRERL